MTHAELGSVAASIKSARRAKALTQRELGQRVGLPQSHVSKIESGAVDLQLTSLIEIARALDLELKLVPRKALPAVEGAVRAHGTTVETSRALATLAEHNDIARQIKLDFPNLQQAEEFQNAINSIPRIQFDAATLKALNDALKPAAQLRRLLNDHGGAAEFARRLSQTSQALQTFRNVQAHAPLSESSAPRPAYRLEEDDT